jgi:hypothetical protein
MNKLKNLAILLAASLLIIATSCKKDEDKDEPTVKPKTKTELITRSAGWKLTDMKINGVSWMAFADECEKDDITKFTSDGKGTVSEGALVCEDSDAGPFTWKFVNNETQIELDGELGTIVELTDKTLRISSSADGMTGELVYTAQ